jgi:hypothetical protein
MFPAGLAPLLVLEQLLEIFPMVSYWSTASFNQRNFI